MGLKTELITVGATPCVCEMTLTHTKDQTVSENDDACSGCCSLDLTIPATGTIEMDSSSVECSG